MGELKLGASSAVDGGLAASAAPVATVVANIWTDVLGLDAVAPDANFFEVGGDSLAAVRMLAAVEDALLVAVPFTDFLEGPTVAELARALDQAGRLRETRPVPTPTTGPAPCSFAQERLWFVDQLSGPVAAYNEPLALRIRGPLDEAALEQSLRDLLRRHSALRTSFIAPGGTPVQVIDDHVDLDLDRIEVDGAAGFAQKCEELAVRPFDLSRPPLMRAHLLRAASDDHVLLFVFHHSVCDGTSHVIFMRELGELYASRSRGEAPALASPQTEYVDFASRQRDRLRGEDLEAAIAPWRERLADAPAALELCTDYPRPAVSTFGGDTVRCRLDPELSEQVRSFSRTHRSTAYATLLTVFNLLLHRYSGQDTIMVGSATAGRDRPEFDEVIGLFANTVVLRTDLVPGEAFLDLTERVRDTVLSAVAHQNAPFERLVAEQQREPDLSRHPIFQVYFSYRPHAFPTLPGSEPFEVNLRAARVDLTVWVEEAPTGFELTWEYSTDLFRAATIERLQRHYITLLRQALGHPGEPIERLRMLESSERAALLAQSAAVAPEFPVACMHALFEAQAARTPHAEAVIFEGQSLTYSELNERANRLAHRLRGLGIGCESMVALFLERSLEMVVAILGVLKAGAAYVPIDREYPADRLAFVLQDTGAPVLLTQTSLLDRLPEHAARVICLDRDQSQLAHQSVANPEPISAPHNLAYVIYTSGSTGQPKGVQVEHRQIARLFSATADWYGFGPADIWTLAHSYAFDVSVWELWGALAHGGRIVVPSFWLTRTPEAFAATVAEHGITVLCATPSLFSSIQEELLRRSDELALRFVVFAGEALHPPALRPWFDRFGDGGATLVNMYGITETTVHSTYREIRAADCDRDTSPIGVPIPDLSLYLLDPAGEPVPPGVAGEIYVGGAGVTRGYLNRPELNAQRFLNDLFVTERLYRSGDLARTLPDGEVSFLGRIDDQVKIRGFRIELGEIQAVLDGHEAVEECVVVPTGLATGDVRLAAYVVLRASASDTRETRERLRAHLEQKLPPYMVPAAIVFLTELPLTTNGKLDRRALPDPEWERQSDAAFVPPRSKTEALIAQVWKEALGVARVSADDSFFTLGGHSLIAAQVVARLRETAGLDVSVRTLFESPTLAAFAARVQTSGSSGSDALSDARPDRREPSDRLASFQQQQLLYFDHLTPGNAVYNAALATRVHGDLDLEALRGALEDVIGRHEALRTVLSWYDETPVQDVLADWSVELPLVDLSGGDRARRERELVRQARERALAPFDLSRDLMLRTTIFRLGAQEHVILFATHHIAVDAWAVEILYREVAECYDARRSGRSPALPELTAQYRDFASWQRDRLQGQVLERGLDFWRRQLAGAPTVLKLGTDHPRPTEQRFRGETHVLELEAAMAESVRALCAEHRVTPYMLLLAAFATLVYRWTGQDDVLFGGPMANRQRADLEPVIGFLANTIVVRAQLGGNPSFVDLLSRVRDSVLVSYEHQEIPLELVVDAVSPTREPGLNPLFQINFRVRVGPPPTLTLAGTRTEPVVIDLGLARFDLAVELHLLDDRLEAEFNYNSDLFELATIERLARDFEALLEQVVAAPGTRLLSFAVSDAGAAPAPPRVASIRGFRAGR